jgi:type I site-specific restriction endonuclease
MAFHVSPRAGPQAGASMADDKPKPEPLSDAHIRQSLERARQVSQHWAIQFVRIELELSITFSESAIQADERNVAKRERNARNANKSYEAALRALSTVSDINDQDLAEIQRLQDRARQLLTRLGLPESK